MLELLGIEGRKNAGKSHLIARSEMCELFREHYTDLHVQKCFPEVFMSRQTQILLLNPHGAGGNGIHADQGNQPRSCSHMGPHPSLQELRRCPDGSLSPLSGPQYAR